MHGACPRKSHLMMYLYKKYFCKYLFEEKLCVYLYKEKLCKYLFIRNNASQCCEIRMPQNPLPLSCLSRINLLRLADWLTDWPTDQLTERLTEWLTDWLTGCLIDWLTDQPTDWLTDWLSITHKHWPTDRLSDWLTDWPTCSFGVVVSLLLNSEWVQPNQAHPNPMIMMIMKRKT